MWLNFLYYKPWYIQSNHNRCNRVESLSNSLTFVKMNAPVSHSFFLCLSLSVIVSQITVFRMGSEGHQDIDLAILTALLKGGCVHSCVCVLEHECTVSGFHFTVALDVVIWKLQYIKGEWYHYRKHSCHCLSLGVCSKHTSMFLPFQFVAQE